jgi:hypothetical protein
MLGWPNHPIGGGRPPRLEFFFFLKKKCDEGILGIKRSNGLNFHDLKVWGGGGGVKCHFLNFGGKSENWWILQGGKR